MCSMCCCAYFDAASGIDLGVTITVYGKNVRYPKTMVLIVKGRI